VRATVDWGISLPWSLASIDIGIIVKESVESCHVKDHPQAQPQRGCSAYVMCSLLQSAPE